MLMVMELYIMRRWHIYKQFGATFARQVGTGNVTNQITFTNAGSLIISAGEFYNNGGTFQIQVL